MPNGATAATIDAACRWIARFRAASSTSFTRRSLAPVASGDVVLTGGDGARSVRRPAASFKVRRRSLSPKRQAEFDEWIRTMGPRRRGPDARLGRGVRTEIGCRARCRVRPRRIDDRDGGRRARPRRRRCRGPHPWRGDRARRDRASRAPSHPRRPRRSVAVPRSRAPRVARRRADLLPGSVDEAAQLPSTSGRSRRRVGARRSPPDRRDVAPGHRHRGLRRHRCGRCATPNRVCRAA